MLTVYAIDMFAVYVANIFFQPIIDVLTAVLSKFNVFYAMKFVNIFLYGFFLKKSFFDLTYPHSFHWKKCCPVFF